MSGSSAEVVTPGSLDNTRVDLLIRRLGLFAAGGLCWKGATHLFEDGNFAAQISTQVVLVAGYVAGFLLIGAALAHRPTRWATAGVVAACALVFFDYALVYQAQQAFVGTPLTTDVHVYNDYAAWLLRSGENPYAADLLAGYRAHEAPLNFSTPLIDGDLTGRFAYPALHVLAYVPFQWLGFPTRWVYPLFFGGALATILWSSERRFRPLVLLPFFFDAVYLEYAVGGVSDYGWAALLVAMIASWNRPGARALWYGLACSYKHHPWLLAPFLLVRIAIETPGDRSMKARAAAQFALLSASVFSLINLPFFVWDPTAWWAGVTEPARAAMITWGQGPSASVAVGAWSVPKAWLSLWMYGGLVVLLCVYALDFARTSHLVWMVPGIVLFLGHRSLTSYWYFTLFPLVLGVTGSAIREVRRRASIPAAPRWPLAPFAVVGLAAFGAIGGIVYPGRDAGLSARLVGRVDVDGLLARSAAVEVSNRSPVDVRPRFQVQHGSLQPFFWTVHRGPEVLSAGKTATYVLGTERPYEMFDVREGGRIIVSSADAYSARTQVPVAGDLAVGIPDAVPNGSWRYWANEREPLFWSATSVPDGFGTVADGSGPGYRAVRFTAAPAPNAGDSVAVSLSTEVILPSHPIALYVWVPSDANRPPAFDVQYGVELRVGDRPFHILLGDTEGAGLLPDGAPYVLRQVPRERWERVVLDLRQILAAANVAVPTVRQRYWRFPHLDYPMDLVDLRLRFAARGHAEPVEARFGLLLNDHLGPDVALRYREARADAAMTQSWRAARTAALGDAESVETLRRNAESGGEQAPALWFQVGESEQRRGRSGEARIAFRRAAEGGHRPALSRKEEGWAALAAGDAADAERVFADAVHRFERDRLSRDRGHLAHALWGHAQALAVLGRCEEARPLLARAADLAPAFAVPNLIQLGCASIVYPSPVESVP